ncbi:hypothetical protein TgHK011_008424 [Trichoderma gracile]|nr:hypothetical protein TgHK011_008424 [Trichoderma gracile]
MSQRPSSTPRSRVAVSARNNGQRRDRASGLDRGAGYLSVYSNNQGSRTTAGRLHDGIQVLEGKANLVDVRSVTLQARRRRSYLCDTPVGMQPSAAEQVASPASGLAPIDRATCGPPSTCRLCIWNDAATEGRSTARRQAMKMPGKYMRKRSFRARSSIPIQTASSPHPPYCLSDRPRTSSHNPAPSERGIEKTSETDDGAGWLVDAHYSKMDHWAITAAWILCIVDASLSGSTAAHLHAPQPLFSTTSTSISDAAGIAVSGINIFSPSRCAGSWGTLSSPLRA